jgi:hypothetical protein
MVEAPDAEAGDRHMIRDRAGATWAGPGGFLGGLDGGVVHLVSSSLA